MFGTTLTFHPGEFGEVPISLIAKTSGGVSFSFPGSKGQADTSDFSLEYVIKQRNSFLKRYIPGAVPNSWMTTEMRTGLKIKKFLYGKKYYSEVRGLWRVENDFMGGPFLSLTTTMPDNKNLITVEGYVYAPKYEKREYIRQLEAILYSIVN